MADKNVLTLHLKQSKVVADRQYNGSLFQVVGKPKAKDF